eukprot:TRINITY_DN8819_c0_g4_i1.p1 TRINITY_DN8819_c0_g4~~TRINITY_DN8819_c0_g4_i1.p1  ORF type:complete len:581 (-),score=142.00 TRINITY_DN8819_c0_g4_i1:42-1784(-)
MLTIDGPTVQLLRKYLSIYLEKIPEVLGEPNKVALFVVGLIQRDKSWDEIKQDCREELVPFFKHSEDSDDFVDELFIYILKNAGTPGYRDQLRTWIEDASGGDRKRKHTPDSYEEYDNKRRRYENDNYNDYNDNRRYNNDRDYNNYNNRRHNNRSNFDRTSNDAIYIKRNDRNNSDNYGSNNRNNSRNNRRRTAPNGYCFEFFNTGRCQRGVTCKFIHSQVIDNIPQNRYVNNDTPGIHDVRVTNDEDSDTITLIKVPHSLNTVGNIDTYFSKFGYVESIKVLHKEKKAIIKFSSNEEATKAVNSTEAVFGNRFIKVFWTRDADLQRVDLTTETEKNEPTSEEIAEQKRLNKEKKKELLEKHQKETEAAKQLNEIKAKKLENIKGKQELLDKLIKMSKMELPVETKVKIFQQIETLSDSLKQDLAAFKIGGGVTASSVSGDDLLVNTESLTKNIPEVKRKRKSSNIDLSQFSLDKRTCTFRIVELPSSINDTVFLNKHFSQFGQVNEINFDKNDALIRMDRRIDAERAMDEGNKLVNNGTEVELNVEWEEKKENEEDEGTYVQEFYKPNSYDSDEEMWRR